VREAPRALLEACHRAALRRVDGAEAVRRAVVRRGPQLVLAGEPVPPGAALRVVAAGKAAAAMARALEDWAGDRIADGVAVTKDGHGLPLARIPLLEAAHPVPDARSESAARAVLGVAGRARPDDWLVVLLSGGASSLLAAPLPGLGLEDVRRTTELLLASGAPIEELNAVRKHLTEPAGGRLALATGAARIVVLAISDVLGDAPAVIGSGPCAADPSRYEDALAALARRGLLARVPAVVRRHLEAGARGERPESAKPGAAVFERVRFHVLAASRDALAAACQEARQRGVPAIVVSAALRGEAREAGLRLARLARCARPARSTLLAAAGETTVRVRGAGRGGRCQELALAAALALEGDPRIALLAAGTDGTDGPTDAAGAFADGGSVARGRAAGRDAAADLAANDAYGFFAAEGGLLRTGPTRTNALDLTLVHVAPGSVPGDPGQRYFLSASG
jgi:glycerate 2-kinase